MAGAGDQANVVSLADQYLHEPDEVLEERVEKLEIGLAQGLPDGDRLRLLLRAARHELARRQAETERLADEKLPHQPEDVLEAGDKAAEADKEKLVDKCRTEIDHELEGMARQLQLQGVDDEADDRQAARSASPQPQPTYTKEDYINVYRAVSSSVVTVFIEHEVAEPGVHKLAMKPLARERKCVKGAKPLARKQKCVEEATGFIVGIKRGKYVKDAMLYIMVAVHSHCVEGSLGVREIEFFDGLKSNNLQLLTKIKGSQFRFIEVAEYTPHDALKSVKFSLEGVTTIKEEVFSIVSIFQELCMFKSRVIQSDCEALDERDLTRIEGSENIFSFGCPVAGTLVADREGREEIREANLKKIIGAPIFNMLGEFVGTIESSGLSCDLKFGRQGRLVDKEFTASLESRHFLKKGRCLAEPTKQAPPKRRKKKA